jgi:hypothetical protein
MRNISAATILVRSGERPLSSALRARHSGRCRSRQALTGREVTLLS